ncbi:uncharacterized mitochondrial protein AtMg00300-like [Primulina huaijiensis]|uniref:uncharacterized mitochondrial protein AtMg00300-like n=1 Tax=Primulina huaijiensis TaxID=1492673 RepID=UPI003CC72D0A
MELREYYERVRYVPELKRNLISLGTLDKIGYTFKVENKVLKVSKGALVMMKGIRNNGLYSLVGSTIIGSAAAVAKGDGNKTQLWHKRLGHASEQGLLELCKQGAFYGDKIENPGFCEECVYGKSCRVKFNTSTYRTKATLEYIHSDLWGASRTASLGGAKYFMSIIDDYSRKVWVYILKGKDEAFKSFKEWKALVEK